MIDPVIQKLFAKAFHHGTPDPEAHTAMLMLKKHMNKGGSALDYKIAPHRESSPDRSNLSEAIAALTADLRMQVFANQLLRQENVAKDEALREERAKNRKLGEEVKDLRAAQSAVGAERDRLRAETESLRAAADIQSNAGTKYIAWDAFAKAFDRAFGHQRWKAILAFHADINLGTLLAWQKVGIAPASFLNLLKTLTGERKASSSRRPWARGEIESLKQLVQVGHADHEIAKMLTESFGRRLLETAITRARRRFGIRRGRRQVGG